MSVKFSLSEIIAAILNEIKAALKEYANQAEVAFKKRIKKLLIISIFGAVLMSLGISLAGSAALFILIGSLRYLETSSLPGKHGSSWEPPPPSPPPLYLLRFF
jgi:hypothetical protein